MVSYEHEWAWAAGFFDGEGCITTTVSHGRYRPQIVVVQKTEPLLARWQLAMGGIGSLRDKSQNREKCYRLWVTRRSEIQLAVDRMWPWLGEVKREQVSRVVEKCRATATGRTTFVPLLVVPPDSPRDVRLARTPIGLVV